jgi:hypothetical protein
MASGHEPGRPEGPALSTFRVCTFYSPAEDIREIDHTIALHHTGASFPVPVPVDPMALAERAMTRLFYRFKKVVPLFLEFLPPFM